VQVDACLDGRRHVATGPQRGGPVGFDECDVWFAARVQSERGGHDLAQPGLVSEFDAARGQRRGAFEVIVGRFGQPVQDGPPKGEGRQRSPEHLTLGRRGDEGEVVDRRAPRRPRTSQHLVQAAVQGVERITGESRTVDERGLAKDHFDVDGSDSLGCHGVVQREQVVARALPTPAPHAVHGRHVRQRHVDADRRARRQDESRQQVVGAVPGVGAVSLPGATRRHLHRIDDAQTRDTG
jgi:hypothetical protein